MNTDFWLTRWDKNQIGWHEQEINPLMERFWHKLEVANTSTIFVPLCGKSNDMLWLKSQGYDVLGVEISALAAETFFEENNLSPNRTQQGHFERWEHDGLAILVGDFFNLTAEDIAHCTAIYDRASLIAMPESMRADYAKHLQNISPDDAKILLITLDYDQEEMKGPPFSVSNSQVDDFYASTHQISMLHTDESALHENHSLKQRGLTHLKENVFLLKPLG